MTKLFLIAALMTLSLTALAEGETASADTPNENCDVRVVSTGGELDAPSGNGGGAPRGGAQSE